MENMIGGPVSDWLVPASDEALQSMREVATTEAGEEFLHGGQR